jgi:hypothetical protein
MHNFDALRVGLRFGNFFYKKITGHPDFKLQKTSWYVVRIVAAYRPM